MVSAVAVYLYPKHINNININEYDTYNIKQWVQIKSLCPPNFRTQLDKNRHWVETESTYVLYYKKYKKMFCREKKNDLKKL